MTLLALVLALPAMSADNQVYLTRRAIDPVLPAGGLTLLADGNVNADYGSPWLDEGYLDGPALSVFDGDVTQIVDCSPGKSPCASISISDGHLGAGIWARPHWSAVSEEAALMYWLFRDVAANYFDAHNTLATPIEDVDNAHELVVLVHAPADACLGSGCMRTHLDTSTDHHWMAQARPDGRDGSVPYTDRPKLFLESEQSTVRIPVHEFGHYYNRVVAAEYGAGGFDRLGSWEEKSLDEGLGYWYAGDYADTQYWNRETDTAPDPIYSDWWVEPPDEDDYDEHHFGDVIQDALWDARQLSGCDVVGWREAVLATVDNTAAIDFADSDPFSEGSVMRGFGWAVLQEARDNGACTQTQARKAAEIFTDRELLPAWIDQRDTGATNEAYDTFGFSVATGDFDGDGRDDLAVGSPYEDSGVADNGKVHLTFGGPPGVVAAGFARGEHLDQADLGGRSNTNNKFGWPMAAGDSDGDGYDDLAVGSPYEDLTAGADAGIVHVFDGSSAGLEPASGFRFGQAALGATIEAGDLFGWALASGDFDGDGYDDLAIGSPGEDLFGLSDPGVVHVVYGSASGLDTSTYDKFNQEDLGSTSEAGDQLGTALAAGDFDGDGDDDLAMSAPYEDLSGVDDAGFVWMARGSWAGLAYWQRFSQISGGSTNDDDDLFGKSLAVGDFDDDGHDDLAVGAPSEDIGVIVDSGYVWLFYGSLSGVMSGSVVKFSQATAGSTNEPYDGFTTALHAADLDADGYDDLAVGIPWEDQDGLTNSGFLHLLYGQASRTIPTRTARIDQTTFATTERAYDSLGNALGSGDFDGDGDVELAIGCQGRDREGANGAGAVFIRE